MLGSNIESFYFREPKKIFCSYYLPNLKNSRNEGIVICPSFGHEYIKSYRALFLLAQELAEAGFSVMRFDYYGTGDSGGGVEDLSVIQAVRDTIDVTNEFFEGTGISACSLIGFRAGSLIACLAAREKDYKSFVFWSPTFKGREFIKALQKKHRSWLLGSYRIFKAPEKNYVEFLGHLFSIGFIKDVEKLNFLTLETYKKKSLILSEPSMDNVISANQWVQNIRISNAEFWNKEDDDFEIAPVPFEDIQNILKWHVQHK